LVIGLDPTHESLVSLIMHIYPLRLLPVIRVTRCTSCVHLLMINNLIYN